MERVCLYVKFPEYLAQWYINECSNLVEHHEKTAAVKKSTDTLQPIHLPKGSQESKILELFLTKPPKDYIPQLTITEDYNLAIVIPCFKNKNPAVQNYLGQKAARLLLETVKNRFCVNLWQEVHSFKNVLKTQDGVLYAYMEAHGITCSEKNWLTIAKIYQRMRNVYNVMKSRNKGKNKSKC